MISLVPMYNIDFEIIRLDDEHLSHGKNREFSSIPQPELALMTKIVDKMMKDLDLRAYHEGPEERIEVKEKKPKKPVAKSMMEALRATAFIGILISWLSTSGHRRTSIRIIDFY